jgi:hypothetical protein
MSALDQRLKIGGTWYQPSAVPFMSARLAADGRGVATRTEPLPRRGLGSVFLIAPEALQPGRGSVLPKLPSRFWLLPAPYEAHSASPTAALPLHPQLLFEGTCGEP